MSTTQTAPTSIEDAGSAAAQSLMTEFLASLEGPGIRVSASEWFINFLRNTKWSIPGKFIKFHYNHLPHRYMVHPYDGQAVMLIHPIVVSHDGTKLVTHVNPAWTNSWTKEVITASDGTLLSVGKISNPAFTGVPTLADCTLFQVA